MKTLRPLLFGLVAGALLAELRAPIGFDLFDALTRDAALDALLRALVLAGIGSALATARGSFAREIPVARLAVGLALGFTLAAVAPGAAAVHANGAGLALRAAAGLALLFLLTRPRAVPGGEPAPQREPNAGSEAAPVRLELFGWGLAGAGAALALAGLERGTRLLGAGQPEDGALFAAVFLAVAALLGAAAFSAPLCPDRRLRPFLRLGLAGVPLAAWFGLESLRDLAQPDAYASQLTGWGAFLQERLGLAGAALDPSSTGTPLADAVLALELLTAPAFLLGIGLGGARDGRRLGSLFLGGAAGALAVPAAVARLGAAFDLDTLASGAAMGRLILLGALLAGVGAALATLAGALRPAAVRVALAISLVLLPLAPWRRVGSVALPLSPWDLFQTELAVAIDDPRGTLTVETLRDGSRAASLDRLRLTPSTDERAADDTRIRRAWELLDPALREAGGARLLFVGQLDPGRWRTLLSLGAQRVDRCVPWATWGTELEGHLFHGESERPPGEPLTPAAARRAVAAGEYDLVLGTFPFGPMPRPRSAQAITATAAPGPGGAHWRAPESGLVVVWLDAASNLAEIALGERVVLASDGVRHLAAGVVLGSGADAELGLRTGAPEPAGSTLERARPRMRDRSDARRAAFTARLALSAVDTSAVDTSERAAPDADLAQGLALFYGAQRASSPFESAAEQLELDPDCLPLLEAAAQRGLGPFLREFWSGLAQLLVEKRMPDLILRHVAPLAGRHAPWPAAARSVAHAYREFGMPAEAAQWFERALGADPFDIDGWTLLGTLEMQAGRDAEAARALQAALALQPGRHDLERALGIALVRAGDPSGRALVEAALAREPGNAELRTYLEPGPYPPLDPGFTVEGGLEPDEHED